MKIQSNKNYFSGQYDIHHQQVEITDKVSLNYNYLVQARDRNEPALIKTFEKRMNAELDRYLDLLRFCGQTMILDSPEGA